MVPISCEEAEKVTPISCEEVGKQAGCLLLLSATDDSMKAWHICVRKLQKFRQGPGFARKANDQGQANGASPGRSYWPEPDAIRRMADRWFGKNQLSQHLNGQRQPVGDPHDHAPSHLSGNVFPRAAFGLPIIFKFRDDGGANGYPA